MTLRLLTLATLIALWIVPIPASPLDVGRLQEPDPSAPSADQESPSAALAEVQTLEQLLALVREQQKLIDSQRQALAGLETRLGQVEGLSLANSNRLADLGTGPNDASVSAAVEQRLAEIENTVHQLPEFTDVVSAGEFPGSLRIPGSDAALRIGGQVRFTSVNSLDAIGTADRFVTSSIPIEGTPDAGKQSRVTYIGTPSRLNFDMRTPTGVGAMRAFVEADFAGTGNSFRLRHAFGQWKKFIVGQTWSTFADPEAEPDGIDFEGLNAISLFRQTQIRFTQPLSPRIELALAAENPTPDVTGAAGVNQIPDLVARVRWEPERLRGALGLVSGIGHLQGSVIVRQIRAEPADQPNTTLSTQGVGANVSARLNPGWWTEKDAVMWAAYAGKGIGRYITDLQALGGQDAVYDPVTDTLEALPVASAYLGYEHWWNDNLRSALSLGLVWVDNLDAQPSDALKRTQRFSLNLSWSPITRIDLVGELLTGRRINKDGQQGDATQFQVGTRFRF